MDPDRKILGALGAQFEHWFDLASDQATNSDVDASIRAGVTFQGTNLWILICATAVASIGLNVNSAAVIIGAMLISPLMGPIMGIGYGAGVNDFALIRSAAKSLGVAVAFSLLTSTVYFLLSPLSEARAEILARTSPTIWDVLIAVFGGLAGIIGSTRKKPGNVIPGVAIATALMPPLCTAGYGIATAQPLYALGALYLFAINSVFIATSTLVMVRLMRLPEVTTVDGVVGTRTRRIIGLFVLLTTVPSVYLAYGLVRQELFINRADSFVADAFPSARGTFVAGKEFTPDRIRVTLVGEPISDETQLALEQSLPAYGLAGAHLEIVQSRQDVVDVESLRKQLTGDLYRDTLVALDEKTHRITALEQQLEAAAQAKQSFGDIGAELRASYPQIADLSVGLGTSWSGSTASEGALLVVLVVTQPLADEERKRIEAWLKVRARVDRVQLATTEATATDAEPAVILDGPSP